MLKTPLSLSFFFDTHFDVLDGDVVLADVLGCRGEDTVVPGTVVSCGILLGFQVHVGHVVLVVR